MIEDFKNVEMQKKCKYLLSLKGLKFLIDLELEVQNLQYEIEDVRRASVPEKVAMISSKLAEMERERQKREADLRATLTANDPKTAHVMNTQSQTINKLRGQLNEKNNLYQK